MIYLSQRDPKWSSLKLGASQLTMGRYGCTTTGISMLSDYFKCYVSPDKIAKRKENYTPDGLILWTKLKFAKMMFTSRIQKYNKTAIEASLSDKDGAVLLQVDGFHWVVGVKKNLIGGDYTIIDTWDGKKKNLKSAYKAITGSAHFKRI